MPRSLEEYGRMSEFSDLEELDLSFGPAWINVTQPKVIEDTNECDDSSRE